MDGSPASNATILELAASAAKPIELRQIKYLNNLIEQNHRAIKRITRPMLGFKSWPCACILIAGIETIRMIKKGQLSQEGTAAPAAEQFYSLAF
ncbi:MAG: DDE-type integrase/transposase/recombinase [Comamonas sp.]